MVDHAFGRGRLKQPLWEDVDLRAIVDHGVDFFDLFVGHRDAARRPIALHPCPPRLAVDENIPTRLFTGPLGIGALGIVGVRNAQRQVVS